jgi:hypothetical protein
VQRVIAMYRLLFIAASAIALGGCASINMDWLPTGAISPSQPVSLRLESEPPGAEARTAGGQACRTPCTLSLPASGDVAVTFTLAGYRPETVPVKLLMPGDPRGDPDAVASVQFNPNPVVAALEPVPPPPPAAKKRSTTAKPRTAAQPAPAARTAPASGSAPAGGSPGMIPGSVPTSPPPGSPWPPLQR